MAGDLHCHTKLSDGSMGIEELIALAKGAGLKSIAITDHDTLAGAMRGKVIGERAGLNVIPGVEFSCKDSKTGRKAHLLCYNPKYPDRLQGLCKEISDKRKSAGQVMATDVMRRYPIPAALIKKWATGSTNIYKVHIMSALMDAGYTTTIYGRLYERLFGENGIVKGELDYPDIRDVIPQVKESGGVAVLAHPYMYDSVDLIPELVELGLDGIEIWHPSNDEERVNNLITIAKQHDLVMTGGSDFHGMYCERPNPIGSATAPDIFVERLMAASKRVWKTLP